MIFLQHNGSGAAARQRRAARDDVAAYMAACIVAWRRAVLRDTIGGRIFAPAQRASCTALSRLRRAPCAQPCDGISKTPNVAAAALCSSDQYERGAISEEQPSAISSSTAEAIGGGWQAYKTAAGKRHDQRQSDGGGGGVAATAARKRRKLSPSCNTRAAPS